MNYQKQIQNYFLLHPAPSHPGMQPLQHPDQQQKHSKTKQKTAKHSWNGCQNNKFTLKLIAWVMRPQHIVRYLLKLYLKITHQDSLKELLAKNLLLHTNITRGSYKLDKSTTEHYKQVIDMVTKLKHFSHPSRFFQPNSAAVPARTDSSHEPLVSK